MRYPPEKTDPTQPNPPEAGLGWLSHNPRVESGSDWPTRRVRVNPLGWYGLGGRVGLECYPEIHAPSTLLEDSNSTTTKD